MRRCSECGTEVTGRLDRQTCSARCRVARSRRLRAMATGNEYFLIQEGRLVPIDAEPIWENDEIVGYAVNRGPR